MANGILLGESLRVGSTLEGTRLTVSKVHRAEAGDEAAGQPRIWTYIDFEFPDDDAHRVANLLSDVLAVEGGWYCDFRTAEDTFVVFAGRVFRYRRGDEKGRAEAQDYARSVGVPESQLDWPE